MNNIAQTKTTYPITLAEAKKHLNIEIGFTDDDDYIDQLIKEATSNAENYIDSDIALTSNIYTEYDFGGTLIVIDVSPLGSVSAISYLDDAGDATAITPGDQIIQKGLQKFNIILDDAISTIELTVTFTSGYSTGVPEAIKRAILLQIGDWFDVQRGSLISKAFDDSDAFYRTLNFYKKHSY